MKHLLLFTFLIFTYIAAGQPLVSFTPPEVNKTYEVDLSDPTLDLELHTTLKNESNQEIRLKWTRVVKTAPMDWETQVCDNNYCYLPYINSNIDTSISLNAPVILAPGESFDLIFHVIPNGAPGEGSFQLVFALASNPDTPIDTAIFSASVNSVTTSNFDIKKSEIRVFPNPATSYFELNNPGDLDRLVVYNLLGREVRSYRVTNGQQYSLAGLPDGLYLLGLINNRKGIVKTVRLNKRSWRP